jgi:hypothetical protein
MKDVRLNNGTMMTDEQFVMERGMGHHHGLCGYQGGPGATRTGTR